MEKIELKNCKEGDYIEVLKDENGLLKNLTKGKRYQVDRVAEKGKIEYGDQNSRVMFRIRNDINVQKWYVVHSLCWFECFRPS